MPSSISTNHHKHPLCLINHYTFAGKTEGRRSFAGESELTGDIRKSTTGTTFFASVSCVWSFLLGCSNLTRALLTRNRNAINVSILEPIFILSLLGAHSIHF
ncbi:hypothetical protein Hdeb2414_s0012g00387041 [Helianthus debilis subsp. tardiflorus]